MTPEEVKLRIKNLFIEKGLSEREVSLKLGKNPTYFNQYLSRPSPVRLSEADRVQLARLLEVSEEELTDLPLNYSKNNISKEDLLFIVDLLSEWTKERNKILDPKRAIELAYIIYDEVQLIAKTEWKAKVYNFADFATKIYAINQ